MHDADGAVPLLHLPEKSRDRVLRVIRRERGRQPKAERPRRRQTARDQVKVRQWVLGGERSDGEDAPRPSSQDGVPPEDLLQRRSVDEPILELLTLHNGSNLRPLLGTNFHTDLAGSVDEDSVALGREVEGDAGSGVRSE